MTTSARPAPAPVTPPPDPATPLADRGPWVAVAGCTVVFALLTLAVSQGWTGGVDAVGRPATAWAQAHGLAAALRVVELGFASVAVTLYVVVLATALLVQRHVRAAVFTVATSVSTTFATGGLKLLVDRERPPWQVGDHVLTTMSFPSGHASASAALVTTAVVLVACLACSARRRLLVVATSALGSAVVVVVAADRVLLGRHYPSDVVAGAALGVGVSCAVAVVCGMARPR